MKERTTRRGFLKTASAAGLTASAGDLTAFVALSPEIAEARITPDLVRYSPEIEPVVRLIEETPIERCTEMLAEQLRLGMPYRRFLAGLFLAALRGPSSIGHSVFVIHSAHQLSLEAPPEERLLPLFWALNNYKYWFNWHAKNLTRLAPFRGVLPPASAAEAEFHTAMDQADAVKAEAALISLMRSQGAHRVMEALWPYAAKDCVNVGHNAIAVTSTWRALPTIGWQHAEPILRWVIAQLVSKGDRTYAPNRDRVRQAVANLPAGWAASGEDAGLTRDLLTLMRDVKTDAACDLVIARLQAGTGRAGAVWDAVHLHACEVMIRKPDDGHPLHANTAANALHHAFLMSSEPRTRLLILLQSIGWQCQHRRRKLETDPAWSASTLNIDSLKVVEIPQKPADTAGEIMAGLSADPHTAARKAFTLALQHPETVAFQAAAHRSMLCKATENAHDIKFPIAVFEDSEQVSAMWRPHLIATATCWLPGTDRPDAMPIQQAREALRTS